MRSQESGQYDPKHDRIDVPARKTLIIDHTLEQIAVRKPAGLRGRVALSGKSGIISAKGRVKWAKK